MTRNFRFVAHLLEKQILARFWLLAAFALTRCFGQATCPNFPAGFVPFSSILYVTAADAAGDHLVVGVPAAGAVNMIASLPLPASINQMFCDTQVQLAPQQLYSGVYVPMAGERTGDFSAFSGLLVNASGQVVPNGVIPLSLQGTLFAWRIGPTQPGSALRGWSPTGSAPRALYRTPAVLLPSGKVFIPATTATSSLLYDPSTGAFSNLATPNYAHGNYVKAILLNNGLVLLAGGQTTPSSAELYDPVTDKFTSLPNMLQGHATNFTATKLQNGRVLIDGGSSTTSYAGAELFDPVTNSFSTAGSNVVPRNYHTATLLSDGRVLIAAGSTNAILNSAEIYNPASNTFSATGSLALARFGADTVLLPNGKVLIVGGYYTGGASEVFDPVAGTFSPTGTANAPHADGGAILLSNGQALIYGGGDGYNATAIADTYNPASGMFSFTTAMSTPRSFFASTLLQDGRVFVAGGAPSASQSAAVSAEIYTPITQGLVTSQTGTTVRVAAGSAAAASQGVAVFSNTATIPWTASTHTYQGGNWLSITPTSGTSAPGAPPLTLTITANPSGLAAQNYYGSVTLTPTDGTHPPVSISVVLNIVPVGAPATPAVTPSALVFLGTPGAQVAQQTFTVSNLTSTAISFSGAGSSTTNWFTFGPPSQTISAGQSATVTVYPSNGALLVGAYPGSVKLTFGDGSAQTVNLLLVVSATPGNATAALKSFATQPTPSASGACSATKLLPVFTTLGTGFNTPAAWPTPIVVEVVDDCGNTFTNGSVVVSFSNGDPPISLLSTSNGSWAGTWVPAHNSTGFSARADAQQLALTGSVQVTGQVFSNPSVPIVSANGVVSGGDFTSPPALGLLVSIFGSGLADAALGDSGAPLPQQLGSTSVVLSGRTLPLLFVSASQVNVAIPYDVAVNSAQQLVVVRGNTVSVPVPLAVFSSGPAVLSVTGSGSGQGLIFNAVTGVLADANAPATAGDPLVIYTLGLGAVTPSITIEDGTPSSPLSTTVAPVTVTIGGVSTQVLFAGLTPGFVGLYQVNLILPSGITPGNASPVTLSVSGRSLQGSVFMAVK